MIDVLSTHVPIFFALSAYFACCSCFAVLKGDVSVGERLKTIRKALGITQQKFADRLNVNRGTLANYEIGKNEPIDAIVISICREFRVNETWLRTGEGEMFQKRSRVDELTDFISSIMDDDDGFRLALITVLSRLEPEQWKTLANIAEQLTREMEAQKRG